ncbi:hypothetical protein HV346_10065 [Enterobacter sp. RHBSTW-00994]|uniref:hypothetical protein n=1 Tax=Enterobacter sp. RHBSTW-00994 TaxID=2742676 RepID=UPI0015EA0089|nr:hypothetical protein [Enterobacter sp. RHBSTW-00994]QLR42996.1 hypothetical protein HV346_10065 [Enterobacter sp. RHBSTW-00994]
MANHSKRKAIGRLIAQGVAAKRQATERMLYITEQQQATAQDLECLKTPPKNRTEAKKQLAVKLRLLKNGAMDLKSLQEIEVQAAIDLANANIRRFEDGSVDAVSTEKTPVNRKKWRGRTAD